MNRSRLLCFVIGCCAVAPFPAIGAEFETPDVRANVMRMLEQSHRADEKNEAPDAETAAAQPSTKEKEAEPPTPPAELHPRVRRPAEHTRLPEKTITIREYLDVDDLEMAIDEANRARREGEATAPAAGEGEGLR